MRMTRSQRSAALALLREMTANGVPQFVTPREAAMLCDQAGSVGDRFRRMAKAEQNSRPIPLAEVAVVIVTQQVGVR